LKEPAQIRGTSAQKALQSTKKLKLSRHQEKKPFSSRQEKADIINFARHSESGWK
jgi:hypothetical protein